MSTLLRDFSRDESGFILSAEMVIILTISVLGMVVGLVNLQNALLGEFADLSMAFQSLNQSYSTPSYHGCWKWWGGRTSWVAGTTFIDIYDGCVANPNAGCYDIQGGSGYYTPMDTSPVVIGPSTTTQEVCPTDLPLPAPAATIPAPAATVTPIPQGTTPAAPAVPCPGC